LRRRAGRSQVRKHYKGWGLERPPVLLTVSAVRWPNRRAAFPGRSRGSAAEYLANVLAGTPKFFGQQLGRSVGEPVGSTSSVLKLAGHLHRQSRSQIPGSVRAEALQRMRLAPPGKYHRSPSLTISDVRPGPTAFEKTVTRQLPYVHDRPLRGLMPVAIPSDASGWSTACLTPVIVSEIAKSFLSPRVPSHRSERALEHVEGRPVHRHAADIGRW